MRATLRELSVADLEGIVNSYHHSGEVRRRAKEILREKKIAEADRQHQVAAEPFVGMTTEQLLRIADDPRNICTADAKAIIRIHRERLAEVRRPYETASEKLQQWMRMMERRGERLALEELR